MGRLSQGLNPYPLGRTTPCSVVEELLGAGCSGTHPSLKFIAKCEAERAAAMGTRSVDDQAGGHLEHMRDQEE